MSPDTPDPDRDEDLSELLDDLETTLADLQSEVRGETGRERERSPPAGRTRQERSQSGSDFPRPPSVSDLLGFTEQYTLPTLISTLEATIRALELLRGTLRLVDPDRSAFEASTGRRETSSVSRLGSGAAGVGREAVSGVERALSELETSLADSEMADDRASDELLGEVRDLSTEIRERLEAAQEPRTADRDDRRWEAGGADRREPEASGRREPAGSDPGGDGVEIEVTDGDSVGERDADGGDSARDDRPEVDVEAELESIRYEVRGGEDADPGAGGAESARNGAGSAGSDADTGADQASDREESAVDDGGESPADDGGEGESPADDEEATTADDGDGGVDTAGTGDDQPT